MKGREMGKEVLHEASKLRIRLSSVKHDTLDMHVIDINIARYFVEARHRGPIIGGFDFKGRTTAAVSENGLFSNHALIDAARMEYSRG
jgi:hypothetical protein